MTTGAARPSPQPREPISWTDLIAAGLRTLTPEPPAIQPTQAAVRRVGAAAYYAAFHALAASNADALTGTAHDPLTAGAWFRIYRGRALAQLRQDRSSLSPQARPSPNSSATSRTSATTPATTRRLPSPLRRQPTGWTTPRPPLPTFSRPAGQNAPTLAALTLVRER